MPCPRAPPPPIQCERCWGWGTGSEGHEMEMSFSSILQTHFPGIFTETSSDLCSHHYHCPPRPAWCVHLSWTDLSPPIFLMGKPRLSCQIFWKFLQGCILG